jgi:transcription initiation factor IIE alpha subunit
MAKKKTPEIMYKCKACGHVPEPDEKQSNENWKVIPTKCPKCGGQVGFDFELMKG